MSRKSKGTFTCKIVAQNERGMLGQVRDSVYRGVKYCGEDGQVEELRSRISRPLEYLMPKPKTERFGLDDVMREATRAAEAWNRNHAAQPTTSRSRGQSR